MKRWSLIGASLLLSSAWLVAQNTSTPPPAAGNAQAQHPTTSQQPEPAQQNEPMATDHAMRTLEGCITSVAGGYTLTDNSGKTFQLSGDPSKLADQAGHWDKVTGSEEPNTAGAAPAAGAPTTFTVRKITIVSATCPTK